MACRNASFTQAVCQLRIRIELVSDEIAVTYQVRQLFQNYQIRVGIFVWDRFIQFSDQSSRNFEVSENLIQCNS